MRIRDDQRGSIGERPEDREVCGIPGGQDQGGWAADQSRQSGLNLSVDIQRPGDQT